MDVTMQSTFAEVAALLALAAALGAVGLLLRQPLIVSFIAVGLMAGPSALDIVHSGEAIELLAELGVAVLLFLVGIKLDLKLIRSLGAVAVTTGLGQVLFTSIFGFLIGLALGLDAVESLYVAVALTFSSTIIIVKLLSDKRELETLHGRIALGFLIVQDLFVVVAMIALSAIGIGGEDEETAMRIVGVLASGLALVGAVVLFIRYVADPLTEKLARAPELLVTFAVALAAAFAATGEAAGLGKEVGGLLAGVALASTPYRETISARLGPLRDFLLLFFFIALGAGLDLARLGEELFTALVFSVFVLVGNPLIVLVIMGSLGYRKETGFLAGLTVAQISEFSLIFVAMGVSLGHVGDGALGLVTLVGLVTIAASTYMITYSHQLYRIFAPFLGVFERRRAFAEEAGADDEGEAPPEIIIFGLGRFGAELGLRLKAEGLAVLGVDVNPAAVRRWRALGLRAEFGDANDAEFVASLPLGRARWIVSSIPLLPAALTHEDARRTLIQIARGAGFGGLLAVTSHDREESRRLAEIGADLVLEPFADAAERAAMALLEGRTGEA
ncbi:MAG: cation:proton antiporter [Pikeienuella sp.]|uniref:cation:proton antiporter n=1 Tax=Pikeienuella sp. TaxID=2831957 RepID=UPI00391BFABD